MNAKISGNTYLVGGFKHDFYFPFHIWDNPSHWLSYFSRWLKPPTRYIYIYVLGGRFMKTYMYTKIPSFCGHGSYPGPIGSDAADAVPAAGWWGKPSGSTETLNKTPGITRLMGAIYYKSPSLVVYGSFPHENWFNSVGLGHILIYLDLSVDRIKFVNWNILSYLNSKFWTVYWQTRWIKILRINSWITRMMISWRIMIKHQGDHSG